MNDALDNLQAVIRGIGPMAVAVSGGVDSMTLAVVAKRVLNGTARMVHAVSPAVPEDASERVRDYAARHGWQLDVVNAHEFDDPDYRANPHNRCFYCKSNLYATMAGAVDCVLVSGTNSNDLGDYRPGLRAAHDHHVRHPYVEAGLDKNAVRGVARQLGLNDLAELPASPCLSSRIETGIGIDPRVLAAVYRAEKLLQRELAPRTTRCRVRHESVVVELDPACLADLDNATAERLTRHIAGLMTAAGVDHPVSFQAYRMGSAFLRPDDGQ